MTLSTSTETKLEKKPRAHVLYEAKQNLFRFIRPDKTHKTYRFQEFLSETQKWTTIHSDEIDAFNRLVKSKALSDADAENRAEAIKIAWYKERDKDNVIPLLMSGNAKVLTEFLAVKYTEAKVKRLAPTSLNAETYYLQNALLALGNVAIEGPIEPIQKAIDDKFEDRPSIHKKRATSINRLRKYLGLTYIEHLRPEKEEVVYLSLAQFGELQKKLDGAYKILCAVAFYTGMRRGEIFALEPSDIKGDVIHVVRQIDANGNLRLPKNRKKRKAFIIPGGEEWLQKWFEIKASTSRQLKLSAMCQEKANIRFHDLRHSYAVYMISKGATIDWVAKSLGHSRETCERFYCSHVLDSDSTALLRGLFK